MDDMDFTFAFFEGFEGMIFFGRERERERDLGCYVGKIWLKEANERGLGKFVVVTDWI
jgi:hypothetical protein